MTLIKTVVCKINLNRFDFKLQLNPHCLALQSLMVHKASKSVKKKNSELFKSHR